MWVDEAAWVRALQQDDDVPKVELVVQDDDLGALAVVRIEGRVVAIGVDPRPSRSYPA